MLIDISSVKRNDGSSLRVSSSLDVSAHASGFSEVGAEGELRNIAGVVSFELSMHGTYTSVCDRCGGEAVMPVTAQIKTIFTNGVSDDDSVTFTDGRIDLEKTVADALILAVPMQVLCSPDCDGVCGDGYELIIEK